MPRNAESGAKALQALVFHELPLSQPARKAVAESGKELLRVCGGNLTRAKLALGLSDMRALYALIDALDLRTWWRETWPSQHVGGAPTHVVARVARVAPVPAPPADARPCGCARRGRHLATCVETSGPIADRVRAVLEAAKDARRGPTEIAREQGITRQAVQSILRRFGG